MTRGRNGLVAHLRIAWRAFKAHWAVFMLSVLVMVGSWICLEMAVVSLQRAGTAVNVALHLVFLIVFSALLVGMHRMALQVLDGRRTALVSLTGKVERGPGYLVVFCLYVLLIVGGLCLFIAPGVYVAVRYALIGRVLAGDHVSPIQAFREAALLSRGRWWPLFGLLLLVAGLNIAGAALLGLGLLISFPVGVLAIMSFARDVPRLMETGISGSDSLVTEGGT